MKALINHLWNCHQNELVQKCRINCHAEGLHSFVFTPGKGATIRLFVATKNHTLWQNSPETCGAGMSVGFHPHHCQVTLAVWSGRIYNWTVRPTNKGMPVTRYRFESPLRGQDGKFVREEECYVETVNNLTGNLGEGHERREITLQARDLHTVYVVSGQEASWFVFEGREDPGFKPICFSNDHLEAASFGNLYKMMDPAYAKLILVELGLIDP